MSLMQKIKDFESSKLRRQFKVGAAYYDCDNIEINARKFEVAYQDEKGFKKRYENIWKANHKVSTGYYPLIVDQKIDFLLANPITYKDMSESDFEYFDSEFQYDLSEVATISAAQGRGWMFPYIQNGEFKRQIIHPDFVIPEYDSYGNITKALRYWLESYKEGNETKTKYIVQVWDAQKVSVYEIKDDKEQLMAEKSHIRDYIKYPNGEMLQTGVNAWGRVPFIELKNDKKCTYDLKRIKAPIDGIDLVSSDFLNNLEDFQDVYWVIKNYNGTNMDSMLRELKDLKVMSVGGDGDAKPETIDIPHEARSKAIEIFQTYIYKFGRGVDVDRGTGGAVTNVDIRSRYQNLMSKSKRFGAQVTKFIKEYAYFAGVHAGRTIVAKPQYTYDMVVNAKEEAEILANSVGILSNKTIWERHPYAAEDEEKRMLEQQQKQLNQFEDYSNKINEEVE